jgi:hypothetical protein
MSIADLNTLYAAAVAASDAGDYDLAIGKGRAILARLATMGKIARTASGDSQSMDFPGYEAIKAFIAECNQAKANAALTAASNSGVFRQSKIRYQRATAAEDYA